MKLKIIAIITLLFSGSLWAAMPPAAQVCGSCHGMQGQGVDPLGPTLAGLSSEYISNQLKLFQTGKRKNQTMASMSMVVQGDMLTQVADYFASQPAADVKLQRRGEKVVFTDPAEQLVYQGDWSRNIPACASCHGPSTIGGGAFPRLAGQHASYTKAQLLGWQSGIRTGDAGNVMKSIADKLTAKEIDSLATYLSTIK